MKLILDLGVIVVLIWLTIRTQRPWLGSALMILYRYLWLPSLLSDAVVFDIAAPVLAFIVASALGFVLYYLYFWLLVRIPMKSPFWWGVMLTMPAWTVWAFIPKAYPEAAA